MRWPSKARDLSKWHRWFAWHPVKLPARNGPELWVWGAAIERQMIYAAGGAAPNYRLPNQQPREGEK